MGKLIALVSPRGSPVSFAFDSRLSSRRAIEDAETQISWSDSE